MSWGQRGPCSNLAGACPAGTVGPVAPPTLTLTNTSIVGSASGLLRHDQDDLIPDQ
jgi:hypothetical protein